MLLLAEFAGLVGQVVAAVPQGEQGGEAALPQAEEVDTGIMPSLQHHWECLLAPSSQRALAWTGLQAASQPIHMKLEQDSLLKEMLVVLLLLVLLRLASQHSSGESVCVRSTSNTQIPVQQAHKRTQKTQASTKNTLSNHCTPTSLTHSSSQEESWAA